MADRDTSVVAMGNVQVLTAPVELDVYTVPKFRETIVALVATGHYRLVVDLSATTFIDSTGLGVLVGSLKRTQAHTDGHGPGWLRLVGSTNERVTNLFRLSGLTKVFIIADNVADAIGADG